ncbi:MAG TPA: tetratricopeptide repeat protein [Candidatus Polarisedimenticolaceae bacterium]|nr:tetratricopeptide repeat protein [Candidatus Polarisedimenticolaceae bacterium]
MKRTVVVALVSFVLGGLAVHAAKTVFDPKAYYAGKEPKEAVAALLARAETIAGDGSWERIGVGRVYYLSGDKAKGQAIFDGVIGGKVAKSDLYRIGDVYATAGEWDKAKPIYERAISMDPEDDRGLLRVGCWYNLNGDRAHAEALFDKAFARSPNEIWHYALAAGSYEGVKPF